MKTILSAFRDWRERRQILGEIRRQQSDNHEVLRFKVKGELTYAVAALKQDDRRQATEIWERLVASHPQEARASPLALTVLLGIARYDDAETLMLEGQKNHPHDSSFLVGLAQVTHARGNYEKVGEYCASLRKRFSYVREGYTLGAEALVLSGRLQEAESLAKQAMKLFPDEVRGYLSFARIAVNRQDWFEALRRWQVAKDRFDHQIAYLGVAQALRHLDRHEEAEQILIAATVRYPTEPTPCIELARLSQAQGNRSLARERWENVIRRFPRFLPGYMAAAGALRELDVTARSEQVLREAVDLFPDEDRPLVDLGKFLFERRNFSAAADVWEIMRRRFPNAEIGYIRGIDALLAAERSNDAEVLREEQRQRFNR